MSTPPQEVNLLKQQVSSLRGGSNSGAAGSSARSPQTKSRAGNNRDANAPYKIALLGPSQSGKTKIAAQIAGVAFSNRYEPTVGVRILEFEEQFITADGREQQRNIELWDCSGDQKYEGVWNVICSQLDGMIVAFDPTNKSQANDVRIWCEWFCKHAELDDGQVVIFAHGELSGTHKPLSVRAGDRTVVVPIVNTSTTNLPPPDEDGRTQPGPAKQEFQYFVANIHQFVTQSGGGAGGSDD